jgi:hypothetical protein
MVHLVLGCFQINRRQNISRNLDRRFYCATSSFLCAPVSSIFVLCSTILMSFGSAVFFLSFALAPFLPACPPYMQACLLVACLPSCLLACLRACLLVGQPAPMCLLGCLPSCLLSGLLACLPTPACLTACLLSCLPASLPTCLRPCLPACLLSLPVSFLLAYL